MPVYMGPAGQRASAAPPGIAISIFLIAAGACHKHVRCLFDLNPKTVTRRRGRPLSGSAAQSRGRAGQRRLTSTMPSATSASAVTSVGVMGSCSHSAPAIRAKIGVRKENADTRVAG